MEGCRRTTMYSKQQSKHGVLRPDGEEGGTVLEGDAGQAVPYMGDDCVPAEPDGADPGGAAEDCDLAACGHMAVDQEIGLLAGAANSICTTLNACI